MISTMPVRYIYKGNIVVAGDLTQIPRKGDFIEIQSWDMIFKVDAVMFKTLLDNHVVAMIYLTDVSVETEKQLRNYKGS